MAKTKLEDEFRTAVEAVRNAPADGAFKPGNDYKLKMYGLYRQATDGDVQGKRPGLLDLVGRMKWDAWAALKGMPREAAMRQYVDEVRKVEAQYG